MKYNEILKVRLSKQDKDDLIALSEMSGMNLSEYIRAVLVKNILDIKALGYLGTKSDYERIPYMA